MDKLFRCNKDREDGNWTKAVPFLRTAPRFYLCLDMENLLRYIHALTPFTQQNWQTLAPALTAITVAKDEYLLETGKVCDALFFVSSGYCRAFQDKEGQDILLTPADLCSISF